MHSFFAPDIAQTYTLPQEESHHCVKVLRLVEGEEIEVIDGKGKRYSCRIALAHPKHCLVEIIEEKQCAPHWQRQIVIGVAPTKNLDRIEWMTEKLTELGVDRVIPLICGNSERKVLKTERLQKIMVSAMKQSLKATLPCLDEPTPLARVIEEDFEGQRFIAYCDPMLPREQRLQLAGQISATGNVMVLIGPEGDFTPAEVDMALSHGFVPVTLGESRLRTETAAVMACATAHVVTSRMG